MNPVRSLGPDLFNGHLGTYWIYLVGPTIGMLVAVAIAWALRGPGHDPVAARAAQGSLGMLVLREKSSQHDGTS
jgi:aquaporin Z